MSNRMSKKELKSDEIVSSLDHFYDYLIHHKEKIIIALVAVIAVVVAYSSLSKMDQKRKEDAFVSLNAAIELLDTNESEALDQLKTIAQKFAKFDEGQQAMFVLVERLYNKGQYKDAVDLSKFAIQKTKKFPELHAKFLLMQAQSFEQMGEYEYAIKSIERVSDMDKDLYLTPELRLSLARSYRLAGHEEKAQEVYSNVVEMYPNTLWAKKAQDMMHA